MPSCHNSNKVASRQRAWGFWHGVPSMIESLDLEILYQAWMAALCDQLVAIREN
jgi:hypothetical protein